MFHDMSQPPSEALGYKHNAPLTFRVWANRPVYEGDIKPWKCLAAFYFLPECLDYIAMCQDAGQDVVFQSPADCREIRATDRRAVYKPEKPAATMPQSSQAFQIIAGSPRRRPAPFAS